MQVERKKRWRNLISLWGMGFQRAVVFSEMPGIKFMGEICVWHWRKKMHERFRTHTREFFRLAWAIIRRPNARADELSSVE
jgi:hypothetical protein